MSQYKNIIFDLDGTLTNPYEGILKALQYTLRNMGYSEIPDDVPHNFIGPPLQKSFSVIYEMNERNTEIAVQFYREYYMKQGWRENIPYDGIIDVLEALSDGGRKLFVATSKHQEVAWEIMRHFELDKYFDDLKGADGSGKHTKGGLIIDLIERYSLDREETVMVGDTHFDMQGAMDADIDVIACGYGFGKEDELRSYNPVTYVEDVEELSEILV